MKEERKCCFFDVCAAYIVREKIEARAGKKWSERFCFGDFERCIHFKDRNQSKQ